MARVHRRAVLGGGAAIVFGFYFPFRKAGAVTPAAKMKRIARPNAFVHIGEDDVVTVLVPKAEMGQGVLTSLPMLVCEELGADFARVKVEHAPAHKDYAMPMSFGLQLTGGSTSVRGGYKTLRKAGASARDLLERTAAKKWNVDRGQVRVENQRVLGPDGKTATFGELVPDAMKGAAKKAPLKDEKAFTLIGTSVPRVDVPEKVDGSGVFGIDVVRPNMLIASIARCPVFGGQVASFKDGKAKAVPGVKHVIGMGNAVAVLADSYFAALKGRKALEITWNEGANARMSTDQILKDYAKAGAEKGEKVRNDGDALGAISKAATKADERAGGERGAGARREAEGRPSMIEAVYDVPFLAHATMEPLNCVADVTTTGCDVWTGTQNQSMSQNIAAEASGLPKNAVRIHTLLLGGGFGRRGEFDFVEEAVRLSREAKAPVKVIWSREDDMQHDFYRPLAWHKFQAAFDASGRPTAWFHRLVSPSIVRRFLKIGSMISFDQDRKEMVWHDVTSTEGARTLPYAFDNVRMEYVRKETGVPIGFWRSVGNSFNGFTTECFFDEVAHAAKKDPYELRRTLLTEHPRHAAVLTLAAEKAGWGTPAPEGRARGIAVHESFGSIVAMVAEVSVAKDGLPHVHRVVTAIDCGPVVNPSIIEAQMESGIVYGLSAALHGKITVEKGRVKQGNFHDYAPIRMKQMPKCETHIVSSTAKMGGAGECAVPTIAPAVCNAIFALTGTRIRSLPIDPALLAT